MLAETSVPCVDARHCTCALVDQNDSLMAHAKYTTEPDVNAHRDCTF